MAFSRTFMWYLMMLAVSVAVVAAGVSVWRRPERRSGLAIAVAIFPGVLMFLLFYSLVVHTYYSVGGWPSTHGFHGLPYPLTVHGGITVATCVVLGLVSTFIWPPTFLACLLVKRWRVATYYLGLYALACLLSFGAMLLAPARFLTWWWD
ncbi:MAG: hypothetical protein ACK4UN_06365 [Limisphaerales bacterium]